MGSWGVGVGAVGLAAGVPEAKGGLDKNPGVGELPLTVFQSSLEGFSFSERKRAAC